MKALLVEDKEYIRKGFLNLLKHIKTNITVIGECESVKDAVVVANSCKPDLVFLDINLTDGNAFDFLQQTEQLQFKVIFITAYEEYALQALKIGAVDYLLKPLDLEELKLAIQKIDSISIEQQQQQIEKAKKAWQNDAETLILSLRNSYQVITLSELLYCESDKGYTTFYLLNNQKHLASKPIKEFENQLLRSSFVRTHQSFIVNLQHIDKYDKSGIVYLKNGVKIPVSLRKKEAFLSTLLSWSKT